MRTLIAFLVVSSLIPAVCRAAEETAADISTRSLLDMLDERQMPDMTLAVLERITADASASSDLKREVPLRRAGALVGMSKTEGDGKKRASYLDEAQKALDEFLASGKFTDVQAIAAYSQKGSLLVERGRTKADQANRPGAEAAPLRAEAIKFFDEAIKSLKGTTKPDEIIKAVTNAEDAVLKVLREVSDKVKALKARDVPVGPGKGGGAIGDPKARAQRAAQETARAARAATEEANMALATVAQLKQQVVALNAAATQATNARNPKAGEFKKAADKAAADQKTAETMANLKVAAAKAANEKAAEAKKIVTEVIAAEKAAGSDKGDDNGGSAPARLTAKEQRQLATLTEEMEALQGKLLQTRMTTAAAVYEKSRAYPPKSKEWKDTVTASAVLFKDLADKYPTKGAGLLAQFYEGRNYALLENWDQTFEALAQLVTIQERIPLAILIRSRSLNTYLEAVIATKKYENFDDSMRKFSLEDPKKLPGGGKLDADWLGLKYRAAVVLSEKAKALDAKDPKTKSERTRLVADIKKLTTEVNLANADFAKEARAIAQEWGKEMLEGERTFTIAWEDAQAAMGMMQQRLAEEKQATATKEPEKIEAAKKATGEARTQALSAIEAAMKLAGVAAPLSAEKVDEASLKEAKIEDITQARYLLTFLLYSAERYEESAAIARLLAESYPNARGSRQAATIGLSALQQYSQRAPDEAARQAARAKLSELATLVMRVWPADSGDAASILIQTAIASRNPKDIASIMDRMPADSPYRRDVLLRGGAALWREVMEARRNEGGTDPAELEAWKTRARKALDEGLAAVATLPALPEGPSASLAVAAALARVQIAMDDGDTTSALATLNHAVYGPWPLMVAESPVLQQGTLAEATLTLALRLFIQSEQFDQAEKAMVGLEKLAGNGAEAAAKLTSMYLSMGRDLQAQLGQMGAIQAKDPQARARAEKILEGFEKFLDRVAARDAKIASQFWVATTYQSLGSGQGAGAVVAKDKANKYLERAAGVYKTLLEKKDDPEVARFEPSIRLKMANIYQVLRQWDEAQQQLDWILSDAKRQNSLDTQIQAAALIQSAADDAAKNGDVDKADKLYLEAAAGRRGQPAVIWGWGNIATKLARQNISGADDKSRHARQAFFNARYRVAECLLALSRLPGKDSKKKGRLEKAETSIAMTYSMYPDLGGAEMAKTFDELAKQVQQERGADPVGLQAFKKEPAAAPPPANQQGAAPAAAGGVN